MPVTLFPMAAPTPATQAILGGAQGVANLGVTNAQIPYLQSQTAMNNAMIPLLPMKIRAMYLGSQGRLLNALNGTSNSYRQWLQTPQGAALAAKDPNLAASVYNQMQQQANLMNNIGYGAVTGNYPNGNINSFSNAPVNSGNPGTPPPVNVGSPGQSPPGTTPQPLPETPQQIARLQQLATNAGVTTPNQFTAGAPTNPNNLNTPASVVQNASASMYADKNIPKKVQSLNYAGQRANSSLDNAVNLLDQVDPNTGEQIGASKYIGPEGQMKLLYDKLMSHITGVTPPSLQNWENFDSALENTKVQAAQLEGVPADQLSRTQFGTVFEVNPFTDTPTLLKSRLQNAQNMMTNAEKANASDLNTITNNQGALKNNQNLTKAIQPNNQIEIPQFNNPKAYNNWFNGLTTQQQKLAVQKIQTPQFNGPQDFQKWYLSLDPIQQEMVKSKIALSKGGK